MLEGQNLAAETRRIVMPLPRWLAQVNKRVFNKFEVRRSGRPVLTHVGRTSGKTYQTPLDAHLVDGGYVFILNYGSDSDWVRNVLAAGNARLRARGDEVDLVNPRVVTRDEAWRLLPPTTKAPANWMNVTEYLRMDLRP